MPSMIGKNRIKLLKRCWRRSKTKLDLEAAVDCLGPKNRLLLKLFSNLILCTLCACFHVALYFKIISKGCFESPVDDWREILTEDRGNGCLGFKDLKNI